MLKEIEGKHTHVMSRPGSSDGARNEEGKWNAHGLTGQQIRCLESAILLRDPLVRFGLCHLRIVVEKKTFESSLKKHCLQEGVQVDDEIKRTANCF